MSQPGTRSRYGLAALMAGAGVAHFAAPEGFERIVPTWAGDPGMVVAVSGVAELGCAALLATNRTAKIGGLVTLLLLIAVFPANIKMALDGGDPSGPPPLDSAAGAWGRLPLQIPLWIWAYRIWKRDRV